MAAKGSIAVRLYPRLSREDRGYSTPCQVWTGGTNGLGYGKIYYEGRLQPVHVVAYKLEVGPIPKGKELDHLCFVTLCANVEHLEPVTPLVNKRRAGVRQLKTHCKWGHLLAPPNLYIHGRNRQCRACVLAAPERRRLGIKAPLGEPTHGNTNS